MTYEREDFDSVIPGATRRNGCGHSGARVARTPACNCTPENLEIPCSVLRTAPEMTVQVVYAVATAASATGRKFAKSQPRPGAASSRERVSGSCGFVRIS